MRKPDFCICENKDADQLRGNREADQRLCFRYTDSIIPLLSKSEISNLYSSSVVVQPGLCRTWSETPKTGFHRTRLICKFVYFKILASRTGVGSDCAIFCSLLNFYVFISWPPLSPTPGHSAVNQIKTQRILLNRLENRL